MTQLDALASDSVRVHLRNARTVNPPPHTPLEPEARRFNTVHAWSSHVIGRMQSLHLQVQRVMA
jgi:hypothetical protein